MTDFWSLFGLTGSANNPTSFLTAPIQALTVTSPKLTSMCSGRGGRAQATIDFVTSQSTETTRRR